MEKVIKLRKSIKISIILIMSYLMVFIGTSHDFKNVKISLNEKPPVIEESTGNIPNVLI